MQSYFARCGVSWCWTSADWSRSVGLVTPLPHEGWGAVGAQRKTCSVNVLSNRTSCAPQLHACFVVLARVQRSKMLSLCLIYAEITGRRYHSGFLFFLFFCNSPTIPRIVIHKIIINTCVSQFLTFKVGFFSLFCILVFFYFICISLVIPLLNYSFFKWMLPWSILPVVFIPGWVHS